MNGAPVLALVVAAVLVLVYGALLSACEAALTRMTRAAAEDLVQDGRRGARRVLDLAERRTQVLGSVAAVRVAVDMLAAVLLTLAVAGLVDRWWAAGLIAVALNRKLPGSGVFQVLYVLPWVCAPLTLGIVWKWLLDPSNGLVNALVGDRVEWMSDASLALPTVAFVYVWQNVGYISLFFLAGLQAIPQSVVEAAKLDGAGPVRLLTRIRLPMLRPTTFFVLVTSFISSFQAFDLVYGLTGGNPGYPGGTTDVVAAQIYRTAFGAPNRIGRASAMAVVLLVFVVAATLIQQRHFSKRTVYERE